MYLLTVLPLSTKLLHLTTLSPSLTFPILSATGKDALRNTHIHTDTHRQKRKERKRGKKRGRKGGRKGGREEGSEGGRRTKNKKCSVPVEGQKL